MQTSPPTRTSTAINAVARETLRRMAMERISPTPEAYARIYAQIAVTHPDHPSGAPVAPTGAEGKNSASLISRLLTQLDAHHSGITVTKKREGLKRALVPRMEPLDALFARLNRLMDSWNGPNAEVGANVGQFLGTDIFGSSATNLGLDDGVTRQHADLPTTSQPFAAPTVFTQSDSDGRGSMQLSTGSRQASQGAEMSEQLISFRLAGLLALLLKNIDELTPESALLGNQVEQIGRVLTAPLTAKKLDETERCLRALIVRQGAIKHSIEETKTAVRELAESLLERLASLVNSTDSYALRIVDMAESIASTNDLGKLSTMTKALVVDARLMSANVAAEREALVETQSRVQTLEARTATLESDLREASTLVRTDPLTRAMNRRGFNDVFRDVVAKASINGLPTVALLDVDNFKRINEEFGHSVGDEVLCGVVSVLHRCAAPANMVARYGGEEFALLFPQLALDEAERAIIKMQRALIDHFAATAAHLPKITFSAGVARVLEGESLGDVITRADRALRSAKNAGKDCLFIATEPAESPAG